LHSRGPLPQISEETATLKSPPRNSAIVPLLGDGPRQVPTNHAKNLNSYLNASVNIDQILGRTMAIKMQQKHIVIVGMF